VSALDGDGESASTVVPGSAITVTTTMTMAMTVTMTIAIAIAIGVSVGVPINISGPIDSPISIPIPHRRHSHSHPSPPTRPIRIKPIAKILNQILDNLNMTRNSRIKENMLTMRPTLITIENKPQMRRKDKINLNTALTSPRQSRRALGIRDARINARSTT
jgi:hypothetical protein